MREAANTFNIQYTKKKYVENKNQRVRLKYLRTKIADIKLRMRLILLPIRHENISKISTFWSFALMNSKL